MMVGDYPKLSMDHIFPKTKKKSKCNNFYLKLTLLTHLFLQIGKWKPPQLN